MSDTNRPDDNTADTGAKPSHFIRTIISKDVAAQKQGGQGVTRFPPEPNGYLHIGHAKSICLNFGIAQEFTGQTNLRFDDTNPTKEDLSYVKAIQEDVSWLGFEWAHKRHASDYFEVFYRCAVKLVKQGQAFVCDLNAEEVREYRGTLTEPGRPSPYRERSVEENLDLLERMRKGEFEDGSRTLRAKIDMSSGNMNLRDPAIYRVRKVPHQNTGDAWCIYPMYDFAHGLSDAIEGITHSLCTLEFEDHRPLYDWFLDQLDMPNDAWLTEPLKEKDLWLQPSRPQQIEFSRLNLDFTVLSKRRLIQLVEENHVNGWDDPRLPTLAGIRRRGYTPESIRTFCEEVGVTKSVSIIPMGVLENTLRDDMNQRAPRAMAVLKPLKVVLTNYPEDQEELMDAAVHPQNPDMGQRQVPFTRELYIEQDDFSENPPGKYRRLKPGGEVRLRHGYIIKYQDVVKNDLGEVVEVHCTYDPDTHSGLPGASRKVKGTIHWVSAKHAVAADVRLYDRLFTEANPLGDKERDFKEFINPESLVEVQNAMVEPHLAQAEAGDFFQFERQGYFVLDPDSSAERPVFNRSVGLRDTWAKIKK
ncbi:MAG: glutamine--tRNA ligase/YqeY domain fusion protein [Xanthomonadales bacterium]|nr:glutamine--tRNA ligase/YqeY domain fusion protein [Xanthomonadales bacterium]